MLKIAVFVSGRGSNLNAILEKVPSEKISICALISDRKNCKAVQFAESKQIPVYFVTNKEAEGFITYNFLIEELKKKSVGLIVLAGFLKKIPDQFVDAFENKIINIHPALLPKYGGSGMYGMNVHKSVFEAKERISGATVHFVDKIYDHGIVIIQKCVDISNASNPEEIADRVLKIEHEILPMIVEKFADGKVSLLDNRVFINE
jgi:formyltetrahydrofolate-dependent phosphoribosylglycinamide formyltransferase